MTAADLKDHVWRRLGPRKWLVGREQVELLTQLTIESWPHQFMSACRTDNDLRIVCKAVAADVKRLHQAIGSHEPQQYGMLWALLLSSIVGAIVQAILKWWLERRSHRTLMLIWQQEGKT